MIDEKKLIDALEDDMDSLFPRVFGKVHPNDAFGLYLELKAMIDNQPKISLENKTSDWIPCSERLPKKLGWYRVTLKSMVDGHRCTDLASYNPNLGFFWRAGVVAWMEEPEPYKGEE